MANEMRDRLVELLNETFDKQYTKSVLITAEHTADHLIENGVVVRKQAKWIYETNYYSCSVCSGKRFDLLLGTDAEYCPYCGAKMIFGEQAEQKLKEMRGE